MKFDIPGLIRVGSAHRLFSGTVLDLTSQYTGYEGGAVSISTVDEVRNTRIDSIARFRYVEVVHRLCVSPKKLLGEKSRRKMHDSCKIVLCVSPKKLLGEKFRRKMHDSCKIGR